MDNEVIHYNSDETGAPTLNNAAGSLIAVLDALLVTGFRALTLTSLSVASGVATATVAAGHGYQDKKMVLVAGAGASQCNGRKLITVVDVNSFTFPAAGAPDGTVSGTITCKRAPLGWAKAYSGTNKAIYARTESGAGTQMLRVDDTGTNTARVLMVESASGVDSYTGAAPTALQLSGGQYWHKGVNSASAKKWVLVGDGRTIHWFAESDPFPTTSYNQCLYPHGFGQLASFRAGDVHASWLAGCQGNQGYYAGGQLQVVRAGQAPVAAGAFVLARMSNGVSGAVFAAITGPSAGTNNPVTGSAYHPAYPSPVDNGMVVQYPMLVSEANVAMGHPFRGAIPGIAAPLSDLSQQTAGLHLLELDNLVGLSRRFLLVAVGANGYGNGSTGMVAMDITGPWQ